MRTPAALGLLVLVLLLGLAVGGWTALFHREWWTFALGLLTTAVLLVALAPGWLSRLPFAVAWVVAVGLAVVPRREGDYLVQADARGYLLLGAALVVLLVGTATLPRPVRRRAPAPPLT